MVRAYHALSALSPMKLIQTLSFGLFAFAAALPQVSAQSIEIHGRKSSVTNPPNIILMMADDMGMGDVNYYAGTAFDSTQAGLMKTPNLDAMAASGLRWDRFYSQSPVCSPTRASCLTGRHPFRIGIWQANKGGLRAEEITLPQILRDYGGYATGHFGKWHLGRFVTHTDWGQATGMDYAPPWERGFDENFSVMHAVVTYDPYGESGLPGGSDYNPYFTGNQEYRDTLFGDTSKLMLDRAIPFMQSAIDDEKPFFVCLWFNSPHKVVDASADDRALFSEESENFQAYAGTIYAMDREIGRLRTWLAEQGIADNTLLWFTTDNGPTGQGSPGPFLGSKRTLYEGGIRVPTVMEWPAKVPTPRVVDAVACTSDYFHTCLDAAGIDYTDTR